MTTAEAALWFAGAFVTLSAFVALLWWLLWPRIEDKLQEVAGEVRSMQGQLDDNGPDTIGRHARVAASAAAELPGIRDQLQQLTDRQTAAAAWQTETDRWRQLWELRLGSVEQALVALLGPELRRRLFDDYTHDRDDERRNTQ